MLLEKFKVDLVHPKVHIITPKPNVASRADGNKAVHVTCTNWKPTFRTVFLNKQQLRQQENVKCIRMTYLDNRVSWNKNFHQTKSWDLMYDYSENDLLNVQFKTVRQWGTVLSCWIFVYKTNIYFQCCIFLVGRWFITHYKWNVC